MATKKKTSNSTVKSKKELEEEIKKLKEVIERNEKDEEISRNIKEKINSIREDLKNQLISQNKFGKQFDDMIEDYLYFVELKERLQLDVDIRGIRYLTTGGNGFVTYKPNESCERLLKTNAQMLKILQDLDLKTPEEGGEEKGDDLLQ